MGYESKKKRRKVWRDDSTVERQTGLAKADPIKCSGSLMSGWPEAWKRLCPPENSNWAEVVASFKDWKYGKVYYGG